MARRFARSERHFKRYVRWERDDFCDPVTHPANMDGSWHLKDWRKSRGLSQEALAEAAGTSKGYISDLESGKRPIPPGRLVERLADALGVDVRDLFRHPDAAPAGEPLVRIIGQAGADTEGRLIHGDADAAYDHAPAPPGGTADAVAVTVTGDSMSAIAPDGSLIYFRDQRTPPTPDMLGYPCVVQTEDNRVLFKRLLRGTEPNTFMLESQYGPPMDNVRLQWAAEPIAIIPAKEARRIIRRSGESQAA